MCVLPILIILEKEIAFSLRPGKGKLFDKDFNELEGGILYANRAIEDGATTTSRLDINAYEDFDKWVKSINKKIEKPRYSFN